MNELAAVTAAAVVAATSKSDAATRINGTKNKKKIT